MRRQAEAPRQIRRAGVEIDRTDPFGKENEAGGIRSAGPQAQTFGPQPRLDLVETDAQPGQLQEPAGAADDPEEAVFGPLGDIAGGEVPGTGARRGGKIGPGQGIALHDAGAGEDQLARGSGARDLLSLGVDQAKGAAGDRAPDRMAPVEHVGSRHIGHAGPGLGLTVHREERPAFGAGAFGGAADHGLIHPAPGLGDAAQPRQAVAPRPLGSDQVELGRHQRQRVDTGVPREIPEPGAGHRHLGHHKGRAQQHLHVQHRHPVGIMERQRGHRPVPRAGVQIIRDGRGVGDQIAA